MLMLRGFYDGSKGSKTVTLAGMSAHLGPWEQAQAHWRQMLERHNMPGLHMKDFSALNGCFTGKTRQAAEAAVNDAVAILGELDTNEFTLRTCTVNKDDYKLAQETEPWYGRGKNQKRLEDLCVDWCLGGLGNEITFTEEDPDGSRIVISFDQNEEFLCRVFRVWQQRKRHAKHWHWADRVETIQPLDSTRFLELQFSDVAAWTCNRHYHQGDRESWFSDIHRSWPNSHKLYDFNALLVTADTRNRALYMELPRERRKRLFPS